MEENPGEGLIPAPPLTTLSGKLSALARFLHEEQTRVTAEEVRGDVTGGGVLSLPRLCPPVCKAGSLV